MGFEFTLSIGLKAAVRYETFLNRCRFMIQLNVGFQIAFDGAPVVAVGALEWFLSSVSPHVPF